ncbi:hypothetical protein EJ03DRAFT_74801 [Teratosphaeria nubilosa]|uniref:Gram-positive cocci surface proteins LPxTG domain-containing protein n=1 Tax=Teratosphaeria nubilosa TaxID=161662 RepID=A0A6G1LME2_9PEZI|nr:hypothetical protein EJ03DRAFT_74801 [Teratosphaeria nubilosa]
MAFGFTAQPWLLTIATLFVCIQHATAQGTQTQGGSSSVSLPPGAADSYTSSSSSDNNSNTDSGVVNYYFVFLALILAIAGLGAFFIWRRRRRALLMMRAGREDALERDVAGWQGGESRSRWYRQGRWGRSDEGADREEGLNEFGEAPPAYAPATSGERAGGGENGQTLAVPMHTLAREGAGLKPPDYTEANVRLVEDPSRLSGASAAGRPQQAEEHAAAGATNESQNGDGRGMTGSNSTA